MVLDRADKLKKAIESRGGAVGRVAAGDEGREADVQRRGGLVNGIQLGEWSGPPRQETPDQIWSDPQPPGLSPAQLSLSPEWHRVQWSSNLLKGKQVATDELEVEQGPGADCSVVAALAVCIGHNRRFMSSVSFHDWRMRLNISDRITLLVSSRAIDEWSTPRQTACQRGRTNSGDR